MDVHLHQKGGREFLLHCCTVCVCICLIHTQTFIFQKFFYFQELTYSDCVFCYNFRNSKFFLAKMKWNVRIICKARVAPLPAKFQKSQVCSLTFKKQDPSALTRRLHMQQVLYCAFSFLLSPLVHLFPQPQLVLKTCHSVMLTQVTLCTMTQLECKLAVLGDPSLSGAVSGQQYCKIKCFCCCLKHFISYLYEVGFFGGGGGRCV